MKRFVLGMLCAVSITSTSNASTQFPIKVSCHNGMAMVDVGVSPRSNSASLVFRADSTVEPVRISIGSLGFSSVSIQTNSYPRAASPREMVISGSMSEESIVSRYSNFSLQFIEDAHGFQAKSLTYARGSRHASGSLDGSVDMTGYRCTFEGM